MGYVDLLVDSIVTMLENLTTTSGTKKQEGHKSIIQLAKMNSFKWKSAQKSAILRIYKNLISD